MNKLEKERKKKIRLLESEIKEMQRDHADTFGYPRPRRHNSYFMDMVIFIVGVICLAIGSIWNFSNMSIPTELAFLSLGFPKFIYAIPLLIGTVAFISCKKSRIPLIIIFVGFAFLFTALVINIEFSVLTKPIWVYITMLAVTCLGFVLSIFTIIRMKRHRHSNED